MKIYGNENISQWADHPMESVTLYLRKDRRTLDMRFKSNKDYYRLYIYKTPYQKLKLKVRQWYFLHPKQWYYRWKYRNGITFGDSFYGVKKEKNNDKEGYN